MNWFSPVREEQNMQHDLLLKRYLSDNERYADLINGFGFGGRQVVSASDLIEQDTQTGQHKNGVGKKPQKKTKNRDLIRKVAFGVNFAVIGVENQDQVHYLMPLRVMDYDVGEYQKQAAFIKRNVQKKKGITDAEFLSGFTKDSKLYPCVTFVLFYGEEWDGSHDLHGLLDFTDIPSELKGLVSNYSINVIEIRKLENTDIFHTDLKQVFDFIRFFNDKKKLKKLVESDPAYQTMEESAYDVAVAFAGAEKMAKVKRNHEKGRKVNMCQALEEMLKDERNEGRNEGRTEGRIEGIEILIQTCAELGASRDFVFTKVKTKFMLQEDETEAYMMKYWRE